MHFWSLLLEALTLFREILVRLNNDYSVVLDKEEAAIESHCLCLTNSTRRGDLELILELVWVDGHVRVRVFLLADSNTNERIGVEYDVGCQTWHTYHGSNPTEEMLCCCRMQGCLGDRTLERHDASKFIGEMAMLLPKQETDQEPADSASA